jgi:hypothetical protein
VVAATGGVVMVAAGPLRPYLATYALINLGARGILGRDEPDDDFAAGCDEAGVRVRGRLPEPAAMGPVVGAYEQLVADPDHPDRQRGARAAVTSDGRDLDFTGAANCAQVRRVPRAHLRSFPPVPFHLTPRPGGVEVSAVRGTSGAPSTGGER